MAEPVGFFVETTIKEDNVKKLLNHSFPLGEPKKKVGYYLSGLLYKCSNEANVLIFHYEKTAQTCFIGWFLNHFQEGNTSPFYKLFPIISALKNTDSTDYAVVASTIDVFEVHEITSQGVKKLAPGKAPKEIINSIVAKLWSFSENNQSFPEQQKALRKRNYFYKNFKNYYKRYLAYQEEVQKPQKIGEATSGNPFHLFGKFYTYNNKVYDLGIMYEFFRSTERIIEIPHADPLTLRDEAGIIADKNFVFGYYLAPNSPPKDAKDSEGRIINNPDAIWEYRIEKDIDGGTFTYLGDRYDAIFHKDMQSVFLTNSCKRLKKIAGADAPSFVDIGFGYAKDKNHTFYNDTIIPINPDKHAINEYGFIYDEQNVFHREAKIPLDAKTFKVIQHEGEMYMGTFILSDKTRKYEYDSELRDDLGKKIVKKQEDNPCV